MDQQLSKYSVTIKGLIVILIGLVSQGSGLPILEDDTETFVSVVIQLIGIGIAWYGRVRKNDIDIMGKRF